MSDLVGFLLARIAEDEAVARAAAERQGEHWFDEEGIVSSDAEPVNPPGSLLHIYAPEGRWNLWDCEGAASLGVTSEVSAHMARHDPARVLAECAAKRRIIALHDQWHECTFGRGLEAAGAVQQDEACPTLRLLALPYADHPDYREEWGL
jgi:hypothetical protein